MEEIKKPRIKLKVISQKGTCEAGHKVGNEFEMMGAGCCPANMCGWAFYTIFPFAMTLMYGGRFPWDKDPRRTTVACPDATNPVVFEVICEE